MKLIRPIKSGKMGIFICPICNKIVEKALNNGKIAKSCGCAQHNYSHGGTGTRLFEIWKGIKKRCLNSNSSRYKDYGGRGISICDEWKNDFVSFRKWAEENGYDDKLIIDRIDNDGNYNPKNCRWVTIAKSNQNSRQSKLTMQKANEIRRKYSTNKISHNDLAKQYNVSKRIITRVLNNQGWVATI